MKINMKTVVPVPDNVGESRLYYKQVLGTIAPCLTSVCCGLTMGITGVMLPQLREDKSIPYNPSVESWIASIAALSMMIGGVCSGQFLDSYGRKPSLIISGIIFIIGWTFIACANSTYLILAGRVITGLGTGFNKAVTLVYIGEIADPSFRKTVLFFPAITSHFGVLISHVVGHYLSWRVSAIVCVIPAIISSFMALFLKESPMWLITKGRKEEGIETFKWFRGTGEASEKELRIFLDRHTEKPKINMRETLTSVCSMSFMKPMLILIALMLNIQFSGLSILVFYSQDIFERTFSGKANAFVIMVVMDFIRCAVSMSNTLIAMCVSKKIAFITSSFGVSVFVIGLVTCLAIKFEKIWLEIFFLLIYMCFSSALVTIGWTFVPELLPSHARGFGAGVNSTFAYLTMFLITKFAPDFMNAYGESALFGFFGVSSFMFGLILSFVLPKTDEKTLQCIEDSYNQNKGRNRGLCPRGYDES